MTKEISTSQYPHKINQREYIHQREEIEKLIKLYAKNHDSSEISDADALNISYDLYEWASRIEQPNEIENIINSAAVGLTYDDSEPTAETLEMQKAAINQILSAYKILASRLNSFPGETKLNTAMSTAYLALRHHEEEANAEHGGERKFTTPHWYEFRDKTMRKLSVIAHVAEVALENLKLTNSEVGRPPMNFRNESYIAWKQRIESLVRADSKEQLTTLCRLSWNLMFPRHKINSNDAARHIIPTVSIPSKNNQ